MDGIFRASFYKISSISHQSLLVPMTMPSFVIHNGDAPIDCTLGYTYTHKSVKSSRNNSIDERIRSKSSSSYQNDCEILSSGPKAKNMI